MPIEIRARYEAAWRDYRRRRAASLGAFIGGFVALTVLSIVLGSSERVFGVAIGAWMIATGLLGARLILWFCPHCSKLFRNPFASRRASSCWNCGLPLYSVDPGEATLAMDEDERSHREGEPAGFPMSRLDLQASGESPADALTNSLDGLERTLGRMCDSLEVGVAPAGLHDSELFAEARRHVTYLLNNPRTRDLGLDGAAEVLDSLLALIIQACDEDSIRRQLGAAYLLAAALSDSVAGRPFLEDHHRLRASDLPALIEARATRSLPALVRVTSSALGTNLRARSPAR